MKTLRRFIQPNATYFITAVTQNREPLLIDSIDKFWNSWDETLPDAWVILPDHFHIIITPKEQTISQLIHRFKIKFSRHIRDNVRPGKVWHNRFWDHVVRDQDDLNTRIDYIHYNPVKHELVDDPFTYEHSSLGKYFNKGLYAPDWGRKLSFAGVEFGE